MPVLKNPKHERFAQELVKGKSQVEAYAAAGYRPDDGAAARLSGNIRVRERVTELQARAAERAEISVATITKRLVDIADKAEKDGAGVPGLNVARQAMMDVAKLNGLVIDKTQRELSEEQMKAVLALVAANPGMAEQLLDKLT